MLHVPEDLADLFIRQALNAREDGASLCAARRVATIAVSIEKNGAGGGLDARLITL